MKNAAIIGISSYARHHLLMVMEQVLQGRLRLVAATIINQEQESFFCARLRAFGCEIFSSTEAMWAAWAGRIHLCFIPTGIHLHTAMTLQALRAGAHVFVEKPLAANVAQVLEVMQAEKTTRRTVTVGFQDIYTPSTWAVKRRLLDGELGTVKSLTLIGLWPRPASYYTRNNWAGRLEYQGLPVMDSPVNNAFAHFINLALFWAGPALDTPASVKSVACELYRTREIETFDTVCARVQLSGKVTLHIYLTHSCTEDRTPRLMLNGTRGSLAWSQESHYEITRPGRPVERHAVPGKFETKFMMADALLNRIEGREARVCTTAIALEHTRLVEALHTAGPTHTVAARHLRKRSTANESWVQLRGIEAACDEAAATSCLWSELGRPWAKVPSVKILDRSAIHP